ncbi:MAG TPA: DivIVA domain-containing protein, partial [Streptosporangiaceae bacterium]
MGIQDVASWVCIVSGGMAVGNDLTPLVRAVRSKARRVEIRAGWWLELAVGLGLLAIGVLSLRYPHVTWLDWVAGVLGSAGLVLLTVPRVIVSRSRARRLGPLSAYTLDLISPDLPGSGPAPAPDPGTADLIERIEHVRFSTVRLVPGYDEREVDLFLDALVAALSRDGRLDRAELRD